MGKAGVGTTPILFANLPKRRDSHCVDGVTFIADRTEGHFCIIASDEI